MPGFPGPGYWWDSFSPFDPNRKGEARVIKISHAGHRANDMAREAAAHNLSVLDYALKLGFGKAEVKEAPQPKKAKEKPKAKTGGFRVEVRPGMLGGK